MKLPSTVLSLMGGPRVARLHAGESHLIPSIATSEYRDQAYILKLLSNFRIRKKKIAVFGDNYWSNTTSTRRNKIISANNGRTLRFLCKMAAQLVDRGKAQRSLRQFSFDRTVDIKRVAHPVDNARSQHVGRAGFLRFRFAASGNSIA